MVPQLYLTVYKQQFASPHGAKRAQLRPTSAHRRNNPQPRPDFLFPQSLQASYKSTRRQAQPSPPGDNSRPVFPPVPHVSFHTPVTNDPNHYQRTTLSDKLQHMPRIDSALPPADRLKTLQLAEPSAAEGFQLHSIPKELQRRMDHLRSVQSLSAQGPRQLARLRPRPQTSSLFAIQRPFPRTQYYRSHSNPTLDTSGCYSCFQVVKPYQAGHYIIHPEFVSECLPHH